MKQILELHAQGHSIRSIARILGISRNSVRKYLREPEIPKAKYQPPRGSKLDEHKEYVRQRVAEGIENCQVLLRELRARGYTGSYTLLKDFVKPLRRPRVPKATVRLETKPGEQAQVDFGLFRYRTPEGGTRSIWAFVMLLSWSRAMYVEFVRRTDAATFIRGHIHGFEALGGVAERILYDNAKVVVLGRDAAGEPLWNTQFLDFALRVDFQAQLCRPYRAQTKGRVERGIQYLRRNFWPTARFVDEEDLNLQVQAWLAEVAHLRVHGTTGERPLDRWKEELPRLKPLPGRERLAVFLREERRAGRDGYVQWERAWYGVPWLWAGKTVEVQADAHTVQIWAGDHRLAVHPRATERGQRFTLPGQWADMPTGDGRPRKEALAVQLPTLEVQQRCLAVYETAAGLGGDR